jgi:hypothetical protein
MDSSSSSMIEDRHLISTRESAPPSHNDVADEPGVDSTCGDLERVTPDLSSEITSQPKGRSSRFIRLLVPKSEEELVRLKRDGPQEYETNPLIAIRVASASLVLCIFDTGITLLIATSINLSETIWLYLVLLAIWASYKFIVLIKRVQSQLYFIREELDERKLESVVGSSPRSTRTSVRLLGASFRALQHCTQASGSSISQSTSPSPSSDEDFVITPPLRRDTENDIGLMPIRRPTYPRQHE